MTANVNGNGGLGGFFKIVPRGNGTPAETPAAPAAGSNSKAAADAYHSSAGGASVLGRSLGSVSASTPLSPTEKFKAAPDLNSLIGQIIKDEFPGLKLSPLQSAQMASHLREQLAARGINDANFQQVKGRLS